MRKTDLPENSPPGSQTLGFGSSILYKCKNDLIGHMSNNKYSINMSIKAFLASCNNVRCSSENDQLVALESALVTTQWNIHGTAVTYY